MNEGAGKTGVRTYKLLGSTDLKTWEEVADIKKGVQTFRSDTIYRCDRVKNYSGLVFLRPRPRLPSFHSPRFWRRLTRSNRFKTLRFEVILPEPLRDAC